MGENITNVLAGQETQNPLASELARGFLTFSVKIVQ